MELICTTCDGLGEERVAIDRTYPEWNVAGWAAHRPHHVDASGMVSAGPVDYYARNCRKCHGEGFINTATSVPVIPRTTI